MSNRINRRGLLKGSMLAGAGFIGLEERILLAALNEGADKETAKKTATGGLPTGRIGDVEISRLIIGGNLIGGWAHARDLLYASELFKAYNNTEEKIFETLELAEEHGINTMLMDHRQIDVVLKYKRERAGEIEIISSVIPEENNPAVHIAEAVDKGASLIYVHGGFCDSMLKHRKMDVFVKALEAIKGQGVPAGIGSHSLEVPMFCEKQGLNPDFYVKTLHHDKYWSAHPRANRDSFDPISLNSDNSFESHDNMWCTNSDETIEFMKNIEKPWIGFKTLAAGAIHPSEGFKFAFENGADFIAVGMFDFQVTEDAIIARDVVAGIKDRQRPWRA
jgi:hypothetical protein